MKNKLLLLPLMLFMLVGTILCVSALTPPAGGVSYYNFFNMTDQWGVNDATNVGTITDSNYPVFNISGNSSPSAAHFEGDTTDYVDTNVVLSGDFSINLWVDIDTGITGNQGVLSTVAAATNRDGINLIFVPGTGFTFFFYDDGSTTEGFNYESGCVDYCDFGLSYDQSTNTAKMYVNGVLFDTEGLAFIIGHDTDVFLGRRYTSVTAEDFKGEIDELQVFDRVLNSTHFENLYNYGDVNGSVPPPTASNSSTESTSIVKQVGSVSFVGTTTILSTSFNVTNNNTPLYGAYSFNVESNNNNNVFCELLINGTAVANVTRTQITGELGSVFLQTPTFLIDEGSYTQDLECSRVSGVGLITVSNAVGVGHFLVDEFNNTLPYNVVNVSATANSGATTFVLLDSFNITIGNQTSSGNLTHNIVVEGGLTYTNNDVLANLTTYLAINSTNGSFYPRTVGAGNTGSVGLDMILENVTADDTYTVSIYGDGINANYEGSFTVKDLFLDHREIVGGTGIITNTSFYNASDTRIFNVSEAGNYNHAVSNAFSKLSYSVLTDVDTTVTFYVKLVDGSNFTGINWSRDFEAGVVGVLTGQDVFEGLPLDTNYEVELWANCGTVGATCTIIGGSSLGYITDVTTTIINAFEVKAFDSWDNSSVINFNVSDGGVHTSDNGTATVFTNNSLLNLTISAENYLNGTVLNHNTSNDLNISLNQSIIRFDALQLFTDINLSGVTFEVADGIITQNTTNNINLKAGNYNVTTYKTGYYQQIQSFTVTALDNLTINITGLHNAISNVTAVRANDSVSINNFNITTSEGQILSTTNGSILVPSIINLSLTTSVASVGFATSINNNITSNVSFKNFTVLLYTFNSIQITIYNGTTTDLLNQNVTIRVFPENGTSSINYTLTGQITIGFLTPFDYELRFSSDNYNTISKFVTITNDSTQAISIYMNSNETYELQVLEVNDIGNNPIESAIVVVQEEVIGVPGGWLTIQEAQTDFNGRTAIYIQRDPTVFYRFAIKLDGEFKEILPDYNLISGKTIFIPGITDTVFIKINVGFPPDNVYEERAGITTSMTNLTNISVTYNWSDSGNSIIGGKLEIVGRYLDSDFTFSVINIQQLNSSIGSLTYVFPVTNNTEYIANGYIVWNTFDELRQTKTFNFGLNSIVDPRTGFMYAAFLFLIVAAITYTLGPLPSLVVASLTLFFSRMMGFISWGDTIISTLIAIIIIIFISVRFRRMGE